MVGEWAVGGCSGGGGPGGEGVRQPVAWACMLGSRGGEGGGDWPGGSAETTFSNWTRLWIFVCCVCVSGYVWTLCVCVCVKHAMEHVHNP